MAEVIAIGDRLFVKIWSKDEEQAAVNNLCFIASGLITGLPTDEELAAFFDDLLGPLWKAVMSTKAAYLATTVQIYRPSANDLYYAAVDQTNAGIGSAGADAMPRQVSGLMGFNAAQSGQRYRGRIYVPFPATQSATDQGEPTAGYIGAMENIPLALAPYLGAGNDVVLASGTVPLIWVIYHRTKPRTAPPADVSIVERAYITTAFATQRRRGTLGKPNKAPV